MIYHCDFCGKEMKRKIKSHGHLFCDKHYNQYKKHGKVLDFNPRTPMDRNEIHVYGNLALVDLYDKDCNVVAQTMIDVEDVKKIKFTKWKLSASGYAMNTPKFSGSNKHLSHEILGVNDCFVDHINHNRLDNRKSNLRIVTKSQNQMNVNYKGVDFVNGKYQARIKINQKQIYLGTYIFEEEALFARWYAEQLLFGEYAYKKDKPIILQDRENDIKEYVNKKVQRL